MGKVIMRGAGRGRPGVKRGPAHNRIMNERKVRELASLGVCPKDIARHQGVGHASVWRFLERLNIERKMVDQYKENRADIFACMQGKALALQNKALDHLLEDGVFEALDDRAKASMVNVINNVFGTSYDKERLERGQSTENHSLLCKIMGGALKESYKATSNGVLGESDAQEKSDSQVQSATSSPGSAEV